MVALLKGTIHRLILTCKRSRMSINVVRKLLSRPCSRAFCQLSLDVRYFRIIELQKIKIKMLQESSFILSLL